MTHTLRNFILAGAAILGLTAASPPKDIRPEAQILAKAGWTFIAVSDETAVFMKDATPSKAGAGIRRVWTAYESGRVRDREGFAFRSVESLGEYDCAGRRSRVVRETFYAEPSLKGRTWVMPNFIQTDWVQPAEGSVGDLRIEFACRTRTSV